MINSKNKFRNYGLATGTKIRFENSPFREKAKKIIRVAVILAIAYFFLAGNRGLIRLAEMKAEKYRLEKELGQMEEENRRSIAEIQALKQDLKAIERIAREDLGLVIKGETVFRFVNVNQDTGVQKR